jgi:hypothetical protein
MTLPTTLDFPIRKAEYLFAYASELGQGGDKQKFWQQIMGFTSAVDIRAAILAEVSLKLLEALPADQYGVRYEAIVQIRSAAGQSRWIKTIWIVLPNEKIARFVTAVPYRGKAR